jgi:hypothetical protein
MAPNTPVRWIAIFSQANPSQAFSVDEPTFVEVLITKKQPAGAMDGPAGLKWRGQETNEPGFLRETR